MQLALVIEKSAKRTKLDHLKVILPSSSPNPSSVYLVQGFSSILLVGELRTHDPHFIHEGRKSWYGYGEGLKNYKKVCCGQMSRAKCGQAMCG